MVKKDKPGKVSGTKGLILVVDDNTQSRELVAEMIRDMGYTPIEAASTESAFNTFLKYSDRIDLVISDIVMPGGDGPDLIEDIRRIKPDLQAIFMSGYTEDEIVHDAVYRVQDSAAVFISKPFGLSDLKPLVLEHTIPIENTP
ncbi:MAG: response regulator [Desulfobacterales bacterium]|nr:response regulator [Desulfobacterales bacterium]